MTINSSSDADLSACNNTASLYAREPSERLDDFAFGNLGEIGLRGALCMMRLLLQNMRAVRSYQYSIYVDLNALSCPCERCGRAVRAERFALNVLACAISLVQQLINVLQKDLVVTTTPRRIRRKF